MTEGSPRGVGDKFGADQKWEGERQGSGGDWQGHSMADGREKEEGGRMGSSDGLNSGRIPECCELRCGNSGKAREDGNG